MKQKSDIERGWEFSSRILGANVGANVGANSVSLVDAQIQVFTDSLTKLKSGQSDAVLGGFVAEYWHAETFNLDSITRKKMNKGT